MTDDPRGIEAAVRVYRVLLRAYPRRAREELGAEMVGFFRQRYRDAWREGGAVRASLACTSAALDVVRCGILERLGPSGWNGSAGVGEEAGETMGDVARDIRLAFRGLARTPVFTLVAVLTLALGIGANAAVFSVLRALVLAPLPYPHLDRLVVIRRALVQRGVPYYPASPADVIDYREADGFESIAALSAFDPILTEGDGEPERVSGGQVTPGFFALLGVTPALGRAFTPEDGLPPDPSQRATFSPPVILSHEFWVRRFGGDPDVLGRTLRFGPGTTTVVGVLPEGFRFVAADIGRLSSDTPDVWAALPIDPSDPYRGSFYLYTIGRLKPGVSVEQATEQMEAITARQRERFANYEAAGTHASVVPFQADASASVRPMLLALFGAVGFVLLIACVNVSNLLLVRASGRTREVAIRAALGGGRARIVRQLLAEAVVLAALGGGAGLFLAWAALPLLGGLVPPDLPRVGTLALDGTVLAFSAAATLLATLVFGLYPALRASRSNLMEPLRGRTGGPDPRHGARSRLVVVEVALSFVLVVGAGLMVRSFLAVRRVDPGFRPEGVLTFEASLPGGVYRSAAERAQAKARLQERLAAIPGVLSVGAGSSLPLRSDRSQMPYGNEVTATDGDESDFRQAWFRIAMPGYFETLGTPLVAGRTFTQAEQDDSTAHVVVDERLAQANWPGESAIGKRLYVKITNPPIWVDVIGVVRNQRQVSLAHETQETIWFTDRAMGSGNTLTWEVRGRGDPTSLATAVKSAVAEVDNRVFVENIRPLSYVVDQARAPTELVLQLASLFAGLALALAVVGLYGVIAYLVRARTEELGLRMALGAGREGIFRMVLRQGLVLAGLGVATGVAGALLLTRTMTSVLVEVAPTDPLTLVAVAVVFAVATVAACLAPAWRAVRVDPIVALRSD